MKKYLINLFALFFISSNIIAQTWIDVQSSSTIYNESGNSVCTDSLGNTFVTGTFRDSIQFGPVKLISTGNSQNIFIVKYSSSMNVLWAKSYGGANIDNVTAIKTDFSGNIYVTGTFYSSITFDSITVTIPVANSIFITKLNSTGNALWVKADTTSGNEFQPTGLKLDVSNNIYIAGYFAGTANFGNNFTLTSINHPLLMSPTIDIFIAKYNNNGICQWAKKGGSYQEDRCFSLAVTNGGNAYITGFYGQDATFSGSTLIYNGGGVDAFIAGYNNSGTLILLKSVTSNEYEAGYGISLDATGNIYITGLSDGATLFDTTVITPHGSYDMFIAKYNSSGNIQWVTNTLSTQWEQGRQVLVDGSGNVYVGGEFYSFGTSSFPGINFTSKGYYDPFVAKYNHEGEFQWAQRGGSYQYDYLNGMALSDSGKVIITGTYGDSARFGNFFLSHSGSPTGTDYYIGKLRSDINTYSVTGLPACAGAATTVTYKVNIPFNSGNIFTAQLSDSKGRFINAVNIGTLSSTVSGTISAIIPINTPTGTGYRIRVVSSDSVRTGGDNGIDLTIWGSPAAVITSGGTNFCSGDSLSIVATAGSGYTWQWKKNWVNISGATSSSYFAKSTGDYKVKVTESVHGCTKISNTIHADLRNTPNANITPASTTTFCLGGSVLLNANTGNNFTYQWKKSGNNILNATNSSYTVSVAGNYTVKVTNSYGCTKVSSAISVIVNPLPIVSFTGLATSYNVNDAPGSLTPLPTGGIFTGPGISGYTFFPSIAGLGGPYTITYSYTDANGCTSLASQQTSVVCTVPAIPGNISASGGNSMVCPGESRTYTISAVAGATSYTWTPPAGGVINSGQGTVSVVVSFNGGFSAGDSIKVKANNSCGSGAVKKLFIQRNNPVIPASIAGQSSGVCNLSGVNYSVPFTAGITYAWSFVGGASAVIAGGQGTSAINVNFNVGYTADTLRVSANNACGTSAYKKLTVKAAPATPSSIAGNTAVCANQQNVPYSISPVATATNYTWTGPTGSHISDGITTSTGVTLVTTATSVTVNYGASGGTLKVRANNSCASGSYKNATIAIICRDSEFSAENNFEVTVNPNPSSGDFVFEFKNIINETISIEIFDLVGKRILSSTAYQSFFTISHSALAQGMYMAVIKSGENKKAIRLIKVN